MYSTCNEKLLELTPETMIEEGVAFTKKFRMLIHVCFIKVSEMTVYT